MPGAGRARARIRPGHDAAVLNVSRAGVCVQTRRRLLPGTMVDLALEWAGELRAHRARVVWCTVSGVLADRVIYRGALLFTTRDERVAPSEPT